MLIGSTNNTIKDYAIILNVIYIFGLFSGSALYIGIKALSILNIFLIPSFATNFYLILKQKNPYQILYPLFFLIVFEIFVCIISIFTIEKSPDTFKAMFYLFHILNVYTIAVVTPDIIPTYGVKIAKFFILAWCIWAILQLCVLFQILPQSLTNILWFNSARDEELWGTQISGPFSNSNDFGVVVLLVFLFLNFFSKSPIFRNTFFYLSALMIIMAMSRTALILLILLIPAMQWVNLKLNRMIKGVVAFVVLFLSLALSKNVWADSVVRYLDDNYGYSAITINVKRIISIIDLIDKKVEIDHSSEYRTETYKYAVARLPIHISGDGFQNYRQFYLNGKFSDNVVWKNPHSFLIEIGIAYGLPVLIAFLLFLALMFIYANGARKNKSKRRYFSIMVFYTIILSNIPSSIFLLPLIWFPLFSTYVLTIVSGKKQKIIQT